MSDTILELKNIHKSFGTNHVLKNISLSVASGEFITFLGPSGCGKTTMLRIIAGLTAPDSGSIYLNGTDVTALEPNKRNVNTIFQNYALFPHMNIAANIGYGLKIKGIKKEEIRRQVSDILHLVQLDGFEKKMPSQISGGQKQRVAIARAAVNHPAVLLLDEPLGALDLQLRKYMQTELKQLQKQLGITFIYITHDQEEAMNMSDRIVVMNEGQFEQIGTPTQVYDHPQTSFTAQFVGMANILNGTVKQKAKDSVIINTEHTALTVPCAGTDLSAGMSVTLCVRSENLSLCAAETDNSICAQVLDSSYANGLMTTRMKTDTGKELVSTKYGLNRDYSPGDIVYAVPERIVFVDMEAPDYD